MKKQIEGMTVKKVLTLAVAATMDLSSAAFAAETAITPAPTAMITKAAPVKTTHHKKQHKTVPVQKAQVTKKHHKNAKTEQRTSEQKAQVAKKYAKKYSHQQPAKPATQPAA